MGAGNNKSPKVGSLSLEIPAEPGKSRVQQITELTLSTVGRNALNAKGFAGRGFSDAADYELTVGIMSKVCGNVRKGNLNDLTDMLAAQAFTLDTMFSEYSRMAMCNLGQYPEAVDRYTHLAAKAQANCRATVETLARVKRDGKQTVKVIHVHEGGQAVVADTINQGGGQSARNDGQAQAKMGDASLAALPGPDSSRDGVRLAFDAERAVPDARRKEPRRAER